MVVPHARRHRGLHEVRAPQQLAGARVDHHVVDRVDAGAVGHAPRQPAGVERERGGRPVGVGHRPRAAPCAAARGRRRRRPARPAPPRPRSAPASCPTSRPEAGEPSTFSTRPSPSRLTRSSLSAAAIPSTAWRQRTLVMPSTVSVTGGRSVSRSARLQAERGEVGAHVAQRDVRGGAGGRAAQRAVQPRQHARRAGDRVELDDRLVAEAPLERAGGRRRRDLTRLRAHVEERPRRRVCLGRQRERRPARR